MLVALQMTSPWVQSYKLVAKNTGRFANDLAMGTVIQICDGKMLVALQMNSLWVPSYIFVTKNAGRFADDLAMGTVIQIGCQKYWSFST